MATVDNDPGTFVEPNTESFVTAPPATGSPATRPHIKLKPEPQSEPSRQAWREARQERRSGGVDWTSTIWIGLLHVGVLAAPFTFSWSVAGSWAARQLDLFDSTMLVMGGIIGVGIFFNPHDVARLVGEPGPYFLMWTLGGLAATRFAVIYKELATNRIIP